MRASISKTIIQPAVAEVAEETVTLTMSKEEATLLYRLYYYHVRGDSPLAAVLSPLSVLQLNPQVRGERGFVPLIYGTKEVA